MFPRLALVCFFLGSMGSLKSADETPVPASDLKALQGEWNSPVLPSPGSPDSVIIRKLEFGRKGKSDAVRLDWALYCGRTRITSDESFAGRLIGIVERDKKRLLVFEGAKGARYEVEFELSGNKLTLKGKIKDVDLSYTWTRKPVAKKE